MSQFLIGLEKHGTGYDAWVLQEPRDLRRDEAFPHTRLAVHREYGFMGQIVDMTPDEPEPVVKSEPIPDWLKVEWPDERGSKMIKTDPYGKPLIWAPAGEFKKLKIPPDSHPRHKAIKAYLGKLPPDTPIIIYLH